MLAGSLLLWGILAMAQSAVTSTAQLCAIRFGLGLAEAGYYPGAIYYVSLWLPDELHGLSGALFTCAAPPFSLVGSLTAGWILSSPSLDGLLGLHPWRWLFLLQGAPALLVGLLILCLQPDSPASTRCLSEGERQLLLARLASRPTGQLGAAAVGSVSDAQPSAMVAPSLWVQVRRTLPTLPCLLFASQHFAGASIGYLIIFFMPMMMHELLPTLPKCAGHAHCMAMHIASPSACRAAAQRCVWAHSCLDEAPPPARHSFHCPRPCLQGHNHLMPATSFATLDHAPRVTLSAIVSAPGLLAVPVSILLRRLPRASNPRGSSLPSRALMGPSSPLIPARTFAPPIPSPRLATFLHLTSVAFDSGCGQPLRRWRPCRPAAHAPARPHSVWCRHHRLRARDCCRCAAGLYGFCCATGPQRTSPLHCGPRSRQRLSASLFRRGWAPLGIAPRLSEDRAAGHLDVRMRQSV